MDKGDRLIGALLVGVGLVALLPLAPLGLDPHHDGIMLKPAMDVRAGYVLFRDSFTQYGALTTYLQALALWIHPTLLSLRILTVVAFIVGLLLFYGVWRQVLPRSLAVVSCLLFILIIPVNDLDYWQRALWPLVPWSSFFAVICQGVALLGVFQVVRGQNPVPAAFLLGTAAAAAFWFRQPVGFIMTAGIVVIGVALSWAGWKPTAPRSALLLALLKGTAIVHLPLLGLIAFSGALPEWWYQNFIWPRKWSGAMDWYETLAIAMDFGHTAAVFAVLFAAFLPAWVRRLWPSLPGWAIASYYAMLGGILIWNHAWTLQALALRSGGWILVLAFMVMIQVAVDLTFVHTRRRQTRMTEDYLIGALSVMSLGSLAQLYPSADPWHVGFALAPTFGSIVYAGWRWSGAPPLAVALAIGALFVPSVATKYLATRHALAQPLVTLTQPAVLSGMRVSPTEAEDYRRISAVLDRVQQQRPDIPGVVAGNDALPLCFLSNLTNPTPYFVTWSALATDADNTRRLQYIYRVRPVIFFQRADWPAVNDFYRAAHYLPVLYVENRAMEIAIPQELATAAGLGAYGASRPLESATKP